MRPPHRHPPRCHLRRRSATRRRLWCLRGNRSRSRITVKQEIQCNILQHPKFIIVPPSCSAILGLFWKAARMQTNRCTPKKKNHINTPKTVLSGFVFNVVYWKVFPIFHIAHRVTDGKAHCTKGVCQGTKIDLLALIPRAAEPRECACQGSFLPAKIIQLVFFVHENVSPNFFLATCEESGAMRDTKYRHKIRNRTLR